MRAPPHGDPVVRPKISRRTVWIVAVSATVVAAGISSWNYVTNDCRVLARKLARGDIRSVRIQERTDKAGYVRWAENGNYRWCEYDDFEGKVATLRASGAHLTFDVGYCALSPALQRGLRSGELRSVVVKTQTNVLEFRLGDDDYSCAETGWKEEAQRLREKNVDVTLDTSGG